MKKSAVIPTMTANGTHNAFEWTAIAGSARMSARMSAGPAARRSPATKPGRGGAAASRRDVVPASDRLGRSPRGTTAAGVGASASSISRSGLSAAPVTER